MDKIIKALAKSRPFHNLSEETLKEITPLLKGNVKFFEKGALLLDEGEYVDYIGIVLSGKLAVSNFYSTGDENLVNILEPSYSFGLEITCTYEKLSPFSIYALTDSEVFIFNQNAIFKKGTIPEEYRSIILQDVLKFVANENMRKYQVPVVVAINRFLSDSDRELQLIEKTCADCGADFAMTEVFAKGGEGGKALAQKVVAACEKPSNFTPIYSGQLTIAEKVETLAKEIYGADGVTYTAAAQKALKEIQALGGDRLPVCVAKTQYSLSDNPALLGRPKGFQITVRDMKLSNGAGFVVIYTGDIMTMPGLPKVPAAEKIDVTADGVIEGLF